MPYARRCLQRCTVGRFLSYYDHTEPTCCWYVNIAMYSVSLTICNERCAAVNVNSGPRIEISGESQWSFAL